MAVDSNKVALSKRELEVLQAVAKGSSNQEIATELVISVNTVRVHLRNIFEKLQVQSRTEATMWAIQEGLIATESRGGPAEADSNGTLAASAAMPVPALTLWQQIYFFFAVVVALFFLMVPVIKSNFLRSGIVGFPGEEGVEAETIAGPDIEPDSRWATTAAMPTARTDLTLAAFNNQLFVIGGKRASGTTGLATGLVEIYNIDSLTWREGASKPTPASNVQALVIDDEIYVPGGCDDDGNALSQLEVLDPAANTWRTAAPMPTALCAYAAATAHNELYLIGGWNGADYEDAVHIYNPDQDQWRTLSQPYSLKVGFAAAAVRDNQIYVAGGYDSRREYADVNVLDLETESWTGGPSLRQARGGLGLAAINGDLYAIGGGWTNLLTVNEKLPQNSDEWEVLESPYLNEWRNFGLTALDTEIYVAGGWHGEYLNTIVSYPTVVRIFLPVLQ